MNILILFPTRNHLLREAVVFNLFIPLQIDDISLLNSSITNTTHSFDSSAVLVEQTCSFKVHWRKCLTVEIDALLIRLITLLALVSMAKTNLDWVSVRFSKKKKRSVAETSAWLDVLVSPGSLYWISPLCMFWLWPCRRPYSDSLLACALAKLWQRSDGKHNVLWLVLWQ